MGSEINLLQNYPGTKRDISGRLAAKTEDVRAVAREFGREFFDGDRRFGYGGFNYNPRFWRPVIPDFQRHFGLASKSSLLDVGCAKGFMLHDLAGMIPGITLRGLDISEYAIANAIEDMRPFVQVGDAKELPFEDKSFDVVISINTIHNLDRDGCVKALREIERVSRGKSFITVDAYRNDEEKELMEAWNLTARTVLHTSDWVKLFKEAGYSGDYYWFIP
jgi:ubiquinone/menaquinone biosynthesis C-methylase UbiE